MATAGRILIIPKGKYNEETQYNMLDMVSYGGKGWLCKRPCIGIAPEDGDYWAEAIDVSGEISGLEAMISAETTAREEAVSEVDKKADTATNIAKGRNQSLSYANYQEMVTALNSMGADELNVGQNIYIGTVGVPDVWIYSVASDKVEYVYASDDDIIAEVGEYTNLQIGYYCIAFLEGQKADLISVDEALEEVNAEIDSLRAITPTITLDTENQIAYIVTNQA